MGDGGNDRHPRRCVLEHAGDTGTWHGEAACLNRGVTAGGVTACRVSARGFTARSV